VIRFGEFAKIPELKEVFVPTGLNDFEMLVEGQWIKGHFAGSVRIDQANYGAGQRHAHVYGRQGEEIGVVNVDGSPSHGTKCRLRDDVADALRKKGFKIPLSNLVEWARLESQPILLLESDG
jgi:hypothetical protein